MLDNDMGRSHNTRYRFGPYTLEPDERRILGEGGTPIELTAKAFDLLILLVNSAGQLVTKDEILDAVWPGVSIAESNLTTTISMIRKALQEDSEHRYIETVPKKGYRFVAPVSVVVDQIVGTADQADHISAPVAPKGRRPRFLIAGILIILIAVGIGFGVLQHRHSKTPYQVALRHEAEGNDQLAITELSDLPSSDPNFAEARLKVAWLQYQADRDDKANQALTAIGDVKSSIGSSGSEHGRVTGLKISGLTALLSDQTGEALIDFRSAADADPTDIDALIYIADTAIHDDSFEEADSALAQCLKRDRLNPICGYERIDALGREGKFDQAIDEYNRLHSVSKNPWLDQPAGYAELAKGNIQEARRHFGSLVREGRNESPVHFMAAQDADAAVYLLGGQLAAARRELEIAKKQTSSDYEKADYLILLAKIDAMHGEPNRAKEAKKRLEEAAKDSQAPEFAIEIARIYAMVGDYVSARDFIARQTQAAPGLGKKYAAVGVFVDGLELIERNDFKKAAELLKSSFDKDGNLETAYFLALAEMSLREWDSAIGHLKIIGNSKVRVFVDSVASLVPMSELNLGVCYQAKGQDSPAQVHFSSAREMWKDADPELRARLIDSASGTAAMIRDRH